MKYVLLFLIIAYKWFLSPFLGDRCPYTPTCSMYMYDAVKKHGAAAGFAMGIERLLRCTPYHAGGFDPVRENYKGKIKWLL
jgi:putative membrane protein insertion efficiency factor